MLAAFPRGSDPACSAVAGSGEKGLVMKGLAVIGVVCLAALPALAGPTEDATAHSKAFENAVNARDTAAVVALYEPDAQVIWPGQGEEAKGKSEIETLAANFIKGLPKDAKIVLKSQSAMPLGGDEVATVGHWQETFTDADGKVQTVDIRTTEIIKKVNGKTLYVIDHASIGLPPAFPPAQRASNE
jgi:uncharacterized protein (TIGR02246 family)